MNKTNFGDNWKFWIDRNAFSLMWSVPENAQTVNLPHDAMLETPSYADSYNGGDTGYRDGNVYNYVKELFVSETDKNRTFLLKFDGVYMNSFVYINGQLANHNPFGYSTFYVNLNKHLKFYEKNEIRLIVKNVEKNSRWYSGGGIYRNVYLLSGALTYFVDEGVQITTSDIDENFVTITVKTEINNRNYCLESLKLLTQVLDNSNKVVAQETFPISLFENELRVISSKLLVKHPLLWDEENPNLYFCKSTLLKNDTVIDENIETFGIRQISVDAKRGLRINNKEVKLRGACIHHDNGLLGAKSCIDWEYRKILKLKNAGFNAIRMAHNPMSPDMLRACDELGMYVMDELCDMWTRSKSDMDYSVFFNEWWKKDLKAMVRKDFNHPCVLMYSLGNEIPEIASELGVSICQKMYDYTKFLDPMRFALVSINGVFASSEKIPLILKDIFSGKVNSGQTEGNVNNFMTYLDEHLDEIVTHPLISDTLDKCAFAMDIVGYNYMTARYENDYKLYPNRVIVGSETYPPEIARNWAEILKYKNIIGDFTWTGWDYIGEASVGLPSYVFGEGGFGAKYPCQLAHCGDLDLIGQRQPLSYFREIVFGKRKDPYIAVQRPEHYNKKLRKTPWILSDCVNSYTFDGYENKDIIIEVFSCGDKVELLQNDISLGVKECGEKSGYRVLFDATYKPGKLIANTFLKDELIGSYELKTTDVFSDIKITQERKYCEDLIFLGIELIDKNNLTVKNADEEIVIELDNCKLIGFGSGNPKPLHNYTEDKTVTYNGNALAVIRTTATNAKVVVSTKKGVFLEHMIING